MNEFKEFTINNVPVIHWELAITQCDNIISTAEWAWKSLKYLAIIFCESYCNRSMCKIEDEVRNGKANIKEVAEFADDNECGQKDKWWKAQKLFHKSLSYLPQCRDRIIGCPACAVAEALTYFPIIMKYSPSPPGDVVIINECDNDSGFINVTEYPVPCCISYIINEYGLEYRFGERVRENVFLNLKVDDLPAMPPWLLYDLKEAYVNGQNAVKNLNYLMLDGYLDFDDNLESNNDIYNESGQKSNAKRSSLNNLNGVDEKSKISLDESEAQFAEPQNDIIVVKFDKEIDGWHWFVNNIDKGVVTKNENSIIYKISKILFDQIGCGWTPHQTFYQAIGWTKDQYYGINNEPGRMQKQLRILRKQLGIKILFRKQLGVRFLENVVKPKKQYN